MERNEFSKKAKAKRIIDQFKYVLNSIYEYRYILFYFLKKKIADIPYYFFQLLYLMSMNYRCTRTVCKKKTFRGCDQGIVKQLNIGHQRAFPAVLTHKSGISKDLCNAMRPLFQKEVKPHRLSRIFRVLHTQCFDRLKFVYYNKIYNFNPNVALYYTNFYFSYKYPSLFQPKRKSLINSSLQNTLSVFLSNR